MGFELLSRGASGATFVDKDGKMCDRTSEIQGHLV